MRDREISCDRGKSHREYTEEGIICRMKTFGIREYGQRKIWYANSEGRQNFAVMIDAKVIRAELKMLSQIVHSKGNCNREHPGIMKRIKS